MLTYTTKLIGSPQIEEDLKNLLSIQREVFNFISNIHFNDGKPQNSLKILHSKVYKNCKQKFPHIPVQIFIRVMNECLGCYRSIKSNKYKLSKPVEKSHLSIRLDKRLYSIPKMGNKNDIKITTLNGRKLFQFYIYPKLQLLLDKYKYTDPIIYEQDGQLVIALTFDIKQEKLSIGRCLGVDVGIRRSAAMSDGRIIIDHKFNGEKRKLRYLKRKLQSCGTKSSRRHLKKIRRKEKNKNKNQTHLIANEILKTDCNTIALENLKSIKVKKNKYQNKNHISQVPLFELRRIITYKAEHQGKSIVLVSPAYTSQRDWLTGQINGKRQGIRFYSISGDIYDADVNASINIAKASKLPVSPRNWLDGQADVKRLNVCKSKTSGDAPVLVLQAHQL